MAVDYYKVLLGLGYTSVVIGRGEDSAKVFELKTGGQVIQGGLKYYLAQQPAIPKAAIVCVGIEQLAEITLTLLDYGIKRILLEKPGGLTMEELEENVVNSDSLDAKVFLAYNRRFYSSVLKGKEIIEEDGGVVSFHFEFTERSHQVHEWNKSKKVLEHWFLCNSSHVADMAFFLGGFPKEINCLTCGSLEWHPSAAAFTGSGKAETGAAFSYHANWAAPGRWGVEVMTNQYRLIYRPLEKLSLQRIGLDDLIQVDLEDDIDLRYKPGLFKQVKKFLEGDDASFCTISQQLENFQLYYRMAGY